MSHLLSMSLVFGAFGATSGFYVPYLPVWLEAQGLSASEIAIILSAPAFGRVLLTPAFSAAADGARDQRVVLYSLAGAAALAFLAILPLSGFWALFLLITAATVLWQGTMPITDAMALAFDRRGLMQYGQARLWNSAGFIVSNIAGGIILARSGAGSVYPIMVAGLTIYTLACLSVPASPRAHEPGTDGGTDASVPRRRFLMTVAAAALIQASHSLLYSFGTLHWREFGYSDTTIGFLWALGTFSEIGVFAAAATLLRGVSPQRLIAFAGCAAVVRWTLAPFDLGLGYQILIQVGHAATFGAGHLGVMRFIAASAPPARAASAQGHYAMMMSGSMGLATLGGGMLYGRFGSLAFLGSAVIALAALATLLAAQRQPQSAVSAG